MITITEEAIEKAKEVAEAEGITDLFIRVKILGGGCAGFKYDMYFEEVPPMELDEVFDHDGIKIVCDPLSFQYLDGTEISWEENLLSGGFKFNNPNVSSKCGCGSSFAF